ncbi:methyltransferase family protein [Lacrimispora aerotolerans]|uniref:methyltransferase family protein n=1 Tax=Lacrimispora aerotolerans TaxID=36832 RepID=UPI00047B4016|nr:isoprenylcysteine carboxylmethyltransferase family protein [Lacrimispora aerotolerans]
MIMRYLLFILITTFYIAYFAKQILLRKKGIVTNRLAKGSKPKKTAIIETGLLLITYGMAVFQYAGFFLERYLLPLKLPTSLRWLGIVLAGFGVLFFILAITTMRDSWRAGIDESQKTSMVTRGVYSISRNPAFVGFDLLYIGSALAMPGVVITVMAAAGVLFMHLQILEEEAYLPRIFGDEYVEYKKKTPRYLLFF